MSSGTRLASDDATTVSTPLAHRFEHSLRRKLLSQPGMQFSSLVIRRLRDGVCLEGVLHVEDNSTDLCGLLKKICGVQKVLNHLVVQKARRG